VHWSAPLGTLATYMLISTTLHASVGRHDNASHFTSGRKRVYFVICCAKGSFCSIGHASTSAGCMAPDRKTGPLLHLNVSEQCAGAVTNNRHCISYHNPEGRAAAALS